MAIKKQKRSREESVSAGGEKAQNGGDRKNKSEKLMKKIKLEKQSEPSAKAAGSVPKKIKLEKPSQPAPQAAAGPTKIKKEGAPETSPSKNAKREAKLLKKKENRQEARKHQGQFNIDRINLSKEELEQRIKTITSRSQLSRSARRKLSVFRKKLAIIEGTYKPHVPEVSKKVVKKEKNVESEVAEKANGAAEGSQKKNILNKAPANASGQNKSGKNKAQKEGNKKKAMVQIKTEKSDEEEDDEEENEEEESEEEMDQSQGEASNASDEEEEEDDDEDDEEDDDEDEDEDDEDEDEDDEDEDAEEEKKEEEKITKSAVPLKHIKKEPKTESPEKKQARPEAASEGGKKKRFILFVGNLSYQATEQDIRNHFLTKVSEVDSIRIPTKPGTKEPRGFAYVELTNEADYQKGLSLHDSTINGRKLNVQYTQSGSKTVHKRTEVVAKNKKLHAMRKSGVFGGKQNNRNERRKKQQRSST